MDFSKLLRQIREFIKDLWWRNRTERQAAELALVERRLELMKTYRVTAQTTDRTVVCREEPKPPSPALEHDQTSPDSERQYETNGPTASALRPKFF